METPTENQKYEVTMSLLSSFCGRNETGMSAADQLKTILIIRESHQKSCQNDNEYVSSDNFHQTLGLIDSLKVQLITTITKL